MYSKLDHQVYDYFEPAFCVRRNFPQHIWAPQYKNRVIINILTMQTNWFLQQGNLFYADASHCLRSGHEGNCAFPGKKENIVPRVSPGPAPSSPTGGKTL